MCSFVGDFEGGGWVLVKIHRGRSQPGDNHMNANSIGLREVIDTCSPGADIRYIVTAPSKILTVGDGYL